ncbi:hypothetical protein MIMGU_mgv1a010738mg [Erythranthe guttata]|uniref:F-box domain-containing protein n=1 Tax=Erythranthe guttata TaxID=4155 RepID=A0A022PU88_ERYGU|nr:hypothetical protein MIMGU_mgv1a010738mg [Erythranthe guttata]
MDEIKEKLPYDVVEIILSRLPSKSLLRFKSVCKSWNATISGERFAGVHLRQSRQSSGNQDIFFWCEVPRFTDFSQVMVTKIPQHIRSKMKLEQLEHEQKLEPRVLCYCDGLALLRYGKLLYNQHGELVNNQYVLCNLSAGTHVEFYCPYDEISYIWHKRVYGICYDPSINDYKVIIIDYERYAIYYCRAMRWSEIRETPDEFLGGGLFIGKSVSLNGDFRCQMIKVGGGEKEEELMWVDLNGRPPNSEHVECDMASNIQEYENVLAFDRIYCIETGYQQIPYLENLFISEPRRKGGKKIITSC